MEKPLNALETRLCNWLTSKEGIEALKRHKRKNGRFLRSAIMLVGYVLAINAAELNFSKSDDYNLSLITNEVFRNGDGFLSGNNAAGEYQSFGNRNAVVVGVQPRYV